ncbi:ABC transporter permease subunit [Actinospica durhamensis]|uniref:ABC transporter permease subunit n=1 Tax=Actinospica durhamensis TaxID=1508375 RepID=A0A941ESH3_9ACTN|nr:ABC transporter permease subunit [Actinospica durhamensis]MBR7836710.1 ABC transporter permease subunit [Actinospica durhamensis]
MTWRQFRPQAVAGLVVLVLGTAYFLITGLSIHHTYSADLAACGTADCSATVSAFRGTYAPVFDLTQLLMVVLLALLGTFWGAPLIARELETGTHQLAWNQSVTRTRWLAAKLGGAGLAALAAAGLLSYLLTWWAGPLDPISGSRFSPMTYATHDIVPVGYAVFALTLGCTAGLLIRRTVPAMAVTLAVFVAVQIVMPTLVRPHLLPATTVTYAVNANISGQIRGVEIDGDNESVHLDGLSFPRGAWVLDTTPVENASGQAIRASDYPRCFPGFDSDGTNGTNPGRPGQTEVGGSGIGDIGSCLGGNTLHESMTYQPASHYWPMQWIETGICLAISALMSGFCFWWIRRRT